jgi:hypothetical protein
MAVKIGDSAVLTTAASVRRRDGSVAPRFRRAGVRAEDVETEELAPVLAVPESLARLPSPALISSALRRETRA